MKHIYGVEKYKGEWYVWQFPPFREVAAVAWLARGNQETVRWLCNRETAVEMAGAEAVNHANCL